MFTMSRGLQDVLRHRPALESLRGLDGEQHRDRRATPALRRAVATAACAISSTSPRSRTTSPARSPRAARATATRSSRSHSTTASTCCPARTSRSPTTSRPSSIRWADIAGHADLRYGTVDATPAADRARRRPARRHRRADPLPARDGVLLRRAPWPDADRLLTNRSKENYETVRRTSCATDERPRASAARSLGHCETNFTGTKSGRTGPIAITLPPGYANEDNRAAERALSGRLRAARLRPEARGPRGGRDHLQQLHERRRAARTRTASRSSSSSTSTAAAAGHLARRRKTGTPTGQPECIQAASTWTRRAPTARSSTRGSTRSSSTSTRTTARCPRPTSPSPSDHGHSFFFHASAAALRPSGSCPSLMAIFTAAHSPVASAIACMNMFWSVAASLPGTKTAVARAISTM